MVEEEHPLGALDWTEPNAAGRVYRQVASDDPGRYRVMFNDAQVSLGLVAPD